MKQQSIQCHTGEKWLNDQFFLYCPTLRATTSVCGRAEVQDSTQRHKNFDHVSDISYNTQWKSRFLFLIQLTVKHNFQLSDD